MRKEEEAFEHLLQMEGILEQAVRLMDDLEEKIAAFEAFQPRIRTLEAYYGSPQWKEDFAADEAGQLPKSLKRGVLSEDGIWDMLERNQELLERMGIRTPDTGSGEEPT